MFVSYSLHVWIVGMFTLRQKRIRGESTFARTIVSMPRIAGPYTTTSAARQCCIHTRCTLSWTAGGPQAGSEGQGRSEGEWRGVMEGARGGREGGRKRWCEAGRERKWRNGWRVNKGASEEGTEQGE